jgi:hypothetical protein
MSVNEAGGMSFFLWLQYLLEVLIVIAVNGEDITSYPCADNACGNGNKARGLCYPCGRVRYGYI